MKQLSLPQKLPRLEPTPIIVVEVAAVGAATSSLLLKCRQPRSRRRFREYSLRCSVVTVAHVAEVTECHRRAAAVAEQTQVLLLFCRRRSRCRRRAAIAAAQMQVKTAAAVLCC